MAKKTINGLALLVTTRLAAFASDSGVSQKELADAIGVSRGLVAHWSMGITSVTLRHLEAACKYLEVEPREFLIWAVQEEPVSC